MNENARSSPEERTSRHPRWDKHETLILVTAKRKKWENTEDAAMRSRMFGSLNDTWKDISSYCVSNGVNRSGDECHRQWKNMFVTDYKKIRHWHKLHGVESYWTMSKDKRKEHQLPLTFYREVFGEIESFLGRKPSNAKADGAVGGPAVPGNDEKSTTGNGYHGQNKTHENLVRHSGLRGGEELTSNVKGSVLSTGRNKRKAPVPCDHYNMKQELASVLESSGRAIQEALSDKIRSKIEADNHNSELDRTQRKEQGDSLIGVLGSLAHALGRIADKM